MSNKRRIRHPLAHLDGMTVPGSCCDTEIRIRAFTDGMGSISYAHDDWCDHLDPANQLRATSALRAELARRGADCVLVVDARTAESFLLLGGEPA